MATPARADLPAVLSLIERRLFDPSQLNTLVADWDDAPQALLERSTKVVARRCRGKQSALTGPIFDS